MQRSLPLFIFIPFVAFFVTELGAGDVSRLQAESKVDFNRDVRPLLSDKCFHCHGPDEAHRKAKLRLDVEASARGVIDPSQPEKSGLLVRVESDDPGERMPPPDAPKQLEPEEIATLRRWVEQGAEWEGHWSFAPVVRPELPDTQLSGWVQNDIDPFVLARLEAEGLEPSPQATPYTLARRVSLDLTGLPPSPDIVRAFVADPTPRAYEELVDRLLESPQYGERMASVWLDAARYSDTDGFQLDSTRSNWPWRDWVVDAYNRNLPFDRFTVEQFAGDLLPDADAENILATCFHRSHMTNGEGGRDPEESRVDYVIDRVNTMGTVWLGLTLGCAQCHSHKYDPITHKDYYRLSAFFNSIDEDGKAGKAAKPFLSYKSPHVAAGVADSREWLNAVSAQLARIQEEELGSLEAWLRAHAERIQSSGSHVSWQPATLVRAVTSEATEIGQGPGHELVVSGPNPRHDDYIVYLRAPSERLTGMRLHVLPTSAEPDAMLSLADNGDFVLTNLKISVRSPDSGVAREVSVQSAVADREAEVKGRGYGPVKKVLDDDPRTGWATGDREPTEAATAVFAFAEPVAMHPGEELVVELLHRSLTGYSGIRRFAIEVTSEAGPTVLRVDPSPLEVLAARSARIDRLEDAERKALEEQFLAERSRYVVARTDLTRAKQRLKAYEKALEPAEVMVFGEREERRETHVLVRGVWDKKGEAVHEATPQWLAPWPEGAPKNRLGLARWLVDGRHPLTARVAVNRYWQLYFGAGLVRTPEDFGAQGEPPTHPDLLDWLAAEFKESGWNVKHLQKVILLSATYQQSSEVSPEQIRSDPQNRLLARASRFRLPSGTIRDSILATSGLLNRRLGGPPVFPYQPPGVWADSTMGRFHYQPSVGRDAYRRSLYTFWRRSVAPTTMFDAAQRRVCQVRVVRTNTPLHALTLMNHRTFIEAARILAQDVLHTQTEAAARISEIFWRVLLRPPSAGEIAVLALQLEETQAYYSAHRDEAAELLAQGQNLDHDGPADAVEEAELAELAAYTLQAHTIFNLDEALTRE